MNNVITAIDRSKSYRVYLTITTDMVEEARNIHKTTPLATAGLGRVLTGAGLMGLLLKNKEDKLTVQFKGDGPAEQILATSNGAGQVKGYIVNPNVDLPLTKAGKLDVGGSLGIGELTVIKDMGLKEPYVGSIALVSGEIADDLTAYYYISEQQNTSIALGVKVARDTSVLCAGGMIIQMLPDAEGGAVDALEVMIGKMKPLTTIIEEEMIKSKARSTEGILSATLETIFQELPDEYKPEPMERKQIKWECDCSEERLEKVVMTIGKKDLKQLIEEDGGAELVCQFCEKKYYFDKDHLQRIFDSLK
ncbi:MAG TPA: Hsp33 family molecular chaperone HslO [Anaerovoracaceae bacterium]|nr:Hsp33 family molecular chaperone HslO [Anaerovoracaceae bacterium]